MRCWGVALFVLAGCARAAASSAPIAAPSTALITTTTTSTAITTTTQPTTTTTVAAPSPDAVALTPKERAEAIFADEVPASWQDAVPVHFSIISGTSSWSHPGGLIEFAREQLTGSDSRARFAVAHEFGHQIAFRYGTKAYFGAPPAGWPGAADAERWADCVAVVFTGAPSPFAHHGCAAGADLDFTQTFLDQGPPA